MRRTVFVCIAYTLASVRGHPYRSWLKYKTKIGNLKKKFNEVLISKNYSIGPICSLLFHHVTICVAVG